MVDILKNSIRIKFIDGKDNFCYRRCFLPSAIIHYSKKKNTLLSAKRITLTISFFSSLKNGRLSTDKNTDRKEHFLRSM